MKTVSISSSLSTAIAASVNSGLSWNVTNLVDNDLLASPTVILSIEFLMGDLSVGKFELTISDTYPSFGVVANPTPTTPWDQLGMAQVQVDGAYTTVTEAFYNATGRKQDRLAVVSDLLDGLGLVNLTVPKLGGGGVPVKVGAADLGAADPVVGP